MFLQRGHFRLSSFPSELKRNGRSSQPLVAELGRFLSGTRCFTYPNNSPSMELISRDSCNYICGKGTSKTTFQTHPSLEQHLRTPFQTKANLEQGHFTKHTHVENTHVYPGLTHQGLHFCTMPRTGTLGVF